MAQSPASRYDSQSFSTTGMTTFPFVNPALLQSSDDFFIKLQYGQRIDNLAYTYLGDGHYWWVICLLNGLATPFDASLIAGKLLRIPTSTAKIFKAIEEANISQ
jgi:hypothetical protein